MDLKQKQQNNYFIFIEIKVCLIKYPGLCIYSAFLSDCNPILEWTGKDWKYTRYYRHNYPNRYNN